MTKFPVTSIKSTTSAEDLKELLILEPYYVGLERILNESLNQSVLPGDVLFFGKQLTDVSKKELLANFNSDSMIRLFFPKAQLSQTTINALKKSTIILRSQTGIFHYQHNTGPRRVRYEYSMSFLSLFILVNYGIYARVMSVPFEKNDQRWGEIAIWTLDDIQKYPDYSLKNKFFNLTENDVIEVQPAFGEDFSAILDVSTRIAEIADIGFVIPQIYPNYEAYSTLELRLRNELIRLGSNIDKTINSIYAELKNVSLTTSDLKELDCKQDSEDELMDEVKADSNPQQYALDTIANFPSPFNHIFNVEENDVMLKNPFRLAGSAFEIDHLTPFVNLYITFAIFSYAKIRREWVAGKAQYQPYVGGVEEPKADSSMRNWFYSIATTAHYYSIQEFNSHLLAQNFGRINQKGKCLWRYSQYAYNMSLPVFNKLFSHQDNFYLIRIMQSFKDYKDKYAEFDKLKQMHSVDLLNMKFNLQNNRPSNMFIRKLAPPKNAALNDRHLDKEFNLLANQLADILRVRPSTYIIPDRPIKLYAGDWINASGFFILTPPDNGIPMAGFKFPAYSNLLNVSKYYYGFPYSLIDVLRPQGGKPTFNVKDYYRSVMTMFLRHTKKVPDMTRKEFLQLFFMKVEMSKSVPRVMRFPWDGLTDNETAYYNKGLLPERNEWSQTFKELLQLEKDYKIYFSEHCKADCLQSIKDYFLALLQEIISDAIRQKESLQSILVSRIFSSVDQKRERITKDEYSKPVPTAPKHLTRMASSIKKYSHHDSEEIYKSNEALLQGLILKNNLNNTFFIDYHFKDFSTQEYIDYLLLFRHGNIVSVYINLLTAQSYTDAFTISWYVETYFKQALPVVTYDETNGKLKAYDGKGFLRLLVKSKLLNLLKIELYLQILNLLRPNNQFFLPEYAEPNLAEVSGTHSLHFSINIELKFALCSFKRTVEAFVESIELPDPATRNNELLREEIYSKIQSIVENELLNLLSTPGLEFHQADIHDIYLNCQVTLKSTQLYAGLPLSNSSFIQKRKHDEIADDKADAQTEIALSILPSWLTMPQEAPLVPALVSNANSSSSSSSSMTLHSIFGLPPSQPLLTSLLLPPPPPSYVSHLPVHHIQSLVPPPPPPPSWAFNNLNTNSTLSTSTSGPAVINSNQNRELLLDALKSIVRARIVAALADALIGSKLEFKPLDTLTTDFRFTLNHDDTKPITNHQITRTTISQTQIKTLSSTTNYTQIASVIYSNTFGGKRAAFIPINNFIKDIAAANRGKNVTVVMLHVNFTHKPHNALEKLKGNFKPKPNNASDDASVSSSESDSSSISSKSLSPAAANSSNSQNKSGKSTAPKIATPLQTLSIFNPATAVSSSLQAASSQPKDTRVTKKRKI